MQLRGTSTSHDRSSQSLDRDAGRQAEIHTQYGQVREIIAERNKTDTQRDRRTGRETGIQSDIDTQRQRGREAETQMDAEKEAERDREKAGER